MPYLRHFYFLYYVHTPIMSSLRDFCFPLHIITTNMPSLRDYFAEFPTDSLTPMRTCGISVLSFGTQVLQIKSQRKLVRNILLKSRHSVITVAIISANPYAI